MSVYKKENKFYSLLVILLSLFILFLYTFWKIGDINEKLIENDLLIEQQKNVEEKLIDLNVKKEKISWWEKLNEIHKYRNLFTEDEMLIYLKDKSIEVSSRSPSSFMRIKSISFEEPYVWELGFNESNITLTADFSNINVLKNFLDYLTDMNSDYTFIITNFSLPSNYKKWSLKWVSIPLKYMHK